MAARQSARFAARALRLRAAPARGGREDLLGAEGTARTSLEPEGWVLVDGALWRARTSAAREVAAGARVRVDGIEGLTLTVRPVTGRERTSP
jgi:membrane-bound serine protease (ClpP class)